MTPATEARIRAAFARLADELVEALASEAPSTDAPEQLLSIAESAERLGLARSTIYRELTADPPRLRSVRAGPAGGRRLIPASAIAEYLVGSTP